MRSVLVLSALCGLSSAHFKLNYPKPLGTFDESTEDQAPCGGATPSLSGDLVDFHVGGEALAMTLTHSQGNWLFRATTDEKAAGNWTQLFPIVQQSGIGDFCEPKITVPESWVGKKGYVSVVSSATDGLLFQCVAANFVKGSATAPSSCKNASSVQASFNNDASLDKLVGSGTTNSSGNSSDSDNSTDSGSGSGSGSSGGDKSMGASLTAMSASGAMLLSMGLLGAAYIV